MAQKLSDRVLQARKRREKLTSLKDKGWTYAMIATRYGITRQRAHQIIMNKKTESISTKIP